MELIPAPGGGLTKDGFDSLYVREHRRLWLLAAGLTGRAADADDVLQEAAMLAFGKRQKFQPSGEIEADGSAFCAWLGRFVRNVASNYTRRRHRMSKRRSEGMDPADLGRERSNHEQNSEVENAALVGEVPAWQEAFDDRVAKALERIKPIWRTCLLMNVVAGLTQAEIAVALEMRENTVASHIRRGRERMRELLEPVNPGGPKDAGSPRPTPPQARPDDSEAVEADPLDESRVKRSLLSGQAGAS